MVRVKTFTRAGLLQSTIIITSQEELNVLVAHYTHNPPEKTGFHFCILMNLHNKSTGIVRCGEHGKVYNSLFDFIIGKDSSTPK